MGLQPLPTARAVVQILGLDELQALLNLRGLKLDKVQVACAIMLETVRFQSDKERVTRAGSKPAGVDHDILKQRLVVEDSLHTMWSKLHLLVASLHQHRSQNMILHSDCLQEPLSVHSLLVAKAMLLELAEAACKPRLDFAMCMP